MNKHNRGHAMEVKNTTEGNVFVLLLAVVVDILYFKEKRYFSKMRMKLCEISNIFLAWHEVVSIMQRRDKNQTKRQIRKKDRFHQIPHRLAKFTHPTFSELSSLMMNQRKTKRKQNICIEIFFSRVKYSCKLFG